MTVNNLINWGAKENAFALWCCGSADHSACDLQRFYFVLAFV